MGDSETGYSGNGEVEIQIDKQTKKKERKTREEEHV
jgi:hypothetical protein